MGAVVELSFLQDSIVDSRRQIRILRRALLHAKSELAVLQLLNPNLDGTDHLEATIEIIQRAMRGEEIE